MEPSIHLNQHKFNYITDINSETLISGRNYFTPAGKFPSITTILGKTSYSPWLEAWKLRVGEEEAARISKIATDRGSLVHSYAEKYFNNESINNDLVNESPDVVLMSKAIIQGIESGLTELWGQEIPLWSPTYKFAGRTDLCGLWRGVPSIIDLKTSKKKKVSTDIKDYYLQTTGYAISHNELYNTDIRNIVIIIVTETGQIQIFEKTCLPFKPDLIYRINQYYKLFPTNTE